MIKNLANKLEKSNFLLFRILNSGNTRSRKAKKNIFASFIFKGLNICVGFLILPVALNFIDKSIYGIWLIIGSIMTWVDFFNIGLGNGLRNKFATALAKNDKILARTYVSTTYFILGIIMCILLVSFVIINPFLDWARIFNGPAEMQKEFMTLMYIVFGFFCIRFVTKLITTILIADQKPAISDFVVFSSRLLNLIIIFILSKTTEGSLLKLGFIYSFTPVLVLVISSIYFYSKDYKEFIPSLKFVEMKYAKSLMKLGIKFFILQIAALILFTTDNMIITQLFDPSQVTVYNVAHRYFDIILMSFSIIVTPFWSSVTEAYHNKDIKWIKNTIRTFIRIWICFFVLAVIMLLCSNWVYKIWLGGRIIVPLSLSLVWAMYVLMQSFNSIFVNFINGVGKVGLQIYTALFSIIFNIPLSILFAKYLNMGVPGVLIATMVSTCLSLILRPLQYYKIINNKATGIWNR